MDSDREKSSCKQADEIGKKTNQSVENTGMYRMVSSLELTTNLSESHYTLIETEIIYTELQFCDY